MARRPRATTCVPQRMLPFATCLTCFTSFTSCCLTLRPLRTQPCLKPDVFNPTDLNAEDWMEASAAMGMREIII
eukprot:COSAG06_NODE_21413_length_757_cov_14.294833_2_plen_73_part_01